MKAGKRGTKKPLTPLGKALRERDASLRSAWERDYSDAIKAALVDDVTRLVDLLRAHRRPTDDDLDQFADMLEAMAKRPRGRERDEAVHDTTRVADMLMHVGEGRVSDRKRTAAIEIACKQKAREREDLVDPEQVRDLLRRG